MHTPARHSSVWLFFLYLNIALFGFTGPASASHGGQRVIVVVGSTGSQAVMSAMEAAGVWMHPDADTARNSILYRRNVLLPFTAQLSGNQSVFNSSATDWAYRDRPEDFFLRVAPAWLAENLTQWHKQMASSMMAEVPKTERTWGWKHPYALYTLPYLYQAFPNIHVIHQVQDGRNYAFSSLLRRSSRTSNAFERQFVQLITGKNFTAQQTRTLDYCEAVGQAWALTNHRALRWAGLRATGLRGTYSVVRVEDLCNPARSHAAIQAMLVNAGLPCNDDVIARAVRRLKGSTCHADFWKVMWQSPHSGLAAAVQCVDSSISAALEAFDYVPRGDLDLPEWLQASSSMKQLAAAAAAAAGPGLHPVILTFASNGYERVVLNWLEWLQHSGVNTSHVLIVARGDSFGAVSAVASGTGAAVFRLPVLSPMGAGDLDERGRKADGFRNIRGGVWLERVRTLYELSSAGLSVVLSDLDAIWTHNPMPHLATAAQGQDQGYDLITSRGYFPSEVYKSFKLAGCMGFVYLNGTQPTQFFLRSLLRERLRQLQLPSVRYYNDQRHMNQALVQANLVYNATLENKGLALRPNAVITARKPSTAAPSLRVLFLPESLVQRTCDANSSSPDAWVLHCQSPKSGVEKESFLKQLNLWRQS